MVVRKRQKPPKADDSDILECFHPEGKLCSIIKTNSKAPKRNVFESYRPKPGTCLDYSISQTETKLDAGTTKIRITQTAATYEELVEPPPKVPRKKPKGWKGYTGVPPQWEFIDEKWKRQQEELQKSNRNQIKESADEKTKKDRAEYKKEHISLLEMSGPEWYQELSPNQLKTINDLKNCISQDKKNGTITNTQENMAQLGLVLRPNHNHVKKALKECCGCSVEFLLILYQLIGPERVKYSLNDRLLLSGVVHLTMTPTLRELHVRIPSPPKFADIRLQGIKMNHDKTHYKSPYLVPYTFEPEPRKFSGVYVNKHIQYPESPYFSYLSEFKSALKKKQVLKEHDELYEELQLAHVIYEELFGSPTQLLKASIHVSCENFRNRRNPLPVGIDLSPSSIFIVHGVKKTLSGNMIPILGGVTKLHPPSEYPELLQAPSVVDLGCYDCCKKSKKKRGKPRTNQSTSISGFTETTPIKDEEPEGNSCDSDNTVDLNEPGQTCSDCDSETKETKSESEGIIEDTPGCESTHSKESSKDERKFLESPLDSPGDSKRESPSYKGPGCGCKSAHLEKIENSRCPCAKCEEDRKALNINYIISGIKEGEDCSIPPIPIIAGVSPIPPCECLQNYEERVKQYENYLKRLEAVGNMKVLQHKYLIGGVANTCDGPIFIINGIRKPIECKCAQFEKNEKDELEKLQNMPQVPAGRVKYGIPGVKETPEGNVFILSHAVPIDECDCMKLYDRYNDKHSRCMTVYERYLRKMKDDFNEYMENLGPAKNRSSRMRVMGTNTSQVSNLEQFDDYQEETYEDNAVEDEIEYGNSINADDVDIAGPQGNQEEDIDIMPENDDEEIQEKEEIVEASDHADKEMAKTCSHCQKKRKQKRQVCGHVPKRCNCPKKIKVMKCKDCNCGEPEPEPEPVVVEEEVKKEIIDEPRKVLKRYAIVEKIPCDHVSQNEILKNVLGVMAEDGYPLAKLPDCYKLPHFKLWMEMRCGKYWTQANRREYIKMSRQLWRHTDRCDNKVEIAPLQITRNKAKTLTWFQADYCRKLVSDTILDYYRRVRQNTIDFGREFFPTMFDYEFPTKTFRDCYFAYTPSKEEDVLAAFVWQRFEMKNFSKRKSCFCY